MSNWREDKNFVENYKKRFSNKNFDYIHIKEKTNELSWHDIAEDLKRQIEAVRRLNQNMEDYEAEQAEETRRRAQEITEENRRQKIRQQKYEQRAKPIEFIQSNIFSEPKIKTEPIEDFKIYDNIYEDNELLNANINKIEHADIENDGLEVFFNNSNVKFNNIKSVLKEKLNTLNVEGMYIQIFFKTYDGNLRFQTYSLNNEIGSQIINDLLTQDKSLDNDYYIDEDQNGIIEVSDSNKDYVQTKINSSMLTGFRITNKRNENKEIKNKIYCDNGGSFYIYKINEKFISNTELIKKLERYQIFTTLENKAFEENCLVYAMRQTNLFSEEY